MKARDVIKKGEGYADKALSKFTASDYTFIVLTIAVGVVVVLALL